MLGWRSVILNKPCSSLCLFEVSFLLHLILQSTWIKPTCGPNGFNILSIIERYCAVDIVKTLSINEATASFDEVKTALNGCFAACRNVIVERAQFNRQRQNPSESMDTFIQDLHCLAKNCEYRTLRDDRIIIGVLHDTLSDRLQAKSDLTFTDAAHMSRQAKANKQNWTIVRGVETQNEVDCISQPCSHNKQKATNNQPTCT